ncbi:MAG: HD domain-containing protein [Bacteroidales bacterium]
MPTNKKKIINDPVWGFIAISREEYFDLIEHPYFQRLRRIKQLGLTHLVYPGALHTRFHHSLGAMHLMGQALEVLRAKGVPIHDEEALAACQAILLHDLGHGPFSHALETTIVSGVSHEELTDLFLKELTREFRGLELALEMFRGKYSRQFFSALIAGQLDMDRLDYLRRDSFFTGVSEGQVGSERIIKMLNVVDDQLVVDEKGYLSVQHFLSARRIMYWQVYFHKTVLAAESLLINILRRAQFLASQGAELFATPHFLRFLRKQYTLADFHNDPTLLHSFARIDDFDVFSSIKAWTEHDDPILSRLSRYLVDRRLFRIYQSSEPINRQLIDKLMQAIEDEFNLPRGEGEWFISTGSISTQIYDHQHSPVFLKDSAGQLTELSLHGNPLHPEMVETRYYCCFPRELKKKIE